MIDVTSCIYQVCVVIADDAELDMLAKLVEQEVDEQESSVKHESVAVVESGLDAEPCGGISTQSPDSVVDVGNSEPVANTECVTETDEECQY